jgi:hypothetical protein
MCGLVTTVVVLTVMPKKHASNAQVWTEYHNNTGGWSDGVCFMTGLLNAAFAVGVPDCISHISEEGMSETGEKKRKPPTNMFQSPNPRSRSRKA